MRLRAVHVWVRAGKLEKAIVAMGGRCIWLPKFHACCNGIEYVWGNRKKANRKTCDFKMETLRRTGFKTMLQVEPTFVHKAFRKGRNFMSALRGGADVLTMFKQVANIKKERYVSHRRPAPAQYELTSTTCGPSHRPRACGTAMRAAPCVPIELRLRSSVSCMTKVVRAHVRSCKP